MLQSIRDKSQGWLAWTIVILLCIAFGTWGVHSYLEGGINNNEAAKVNGQEIPATVLNSAYERLRQQRQMQMGADFSLSPSAEASLKQQALQQLIMSNILTHAAISNGFRVTDDQVSEALLRIPAFQIDGQFSRDRFQEILGSLLYNENQFLDDMRAQMLVNQMQGGFVNSEFALPNEVNTAIKLVNQKRDISYLIVPNSRFTKEIQVKDADIRQYYQQHQAEFQSPEQVSVNYLMLSLPAIKAGLHFDQTKLQQYYEDNIDSYMSPQKWHVTHILAKVPAQATAEQIAAAQTKINNIAKQITAGKDFSELAHEYSDDTVSAAKGGELDWYTQGTFDPAFEKAVTNLKNVGDVTAPVKTRYGYSIIKLLAIQKPQAIPFAQAQAQVQSALAQQQAEQIFADANDKLSNLTYANPNTLDIAAKALGLPIQSSNLFSRDGDKSGITANPKVIAAAFSSDVLLQNNNSDVITIDPNMSLVLRIKRHKAAALMPFDEVQALIKDKLAAQFAKQKAKELGQQILIALQDNPASANAIANQYSLNWQTDNNAGRYDSRVDAAILHQAFAIPRPVNNKPSLAGFDLPSGDYSIISLNGVTDGAIPPAGNIQLRVFQEEIENTLGHIDYELYVRNLLNHAKIVTNKSSNSTDNG
jgi:peptidyl-prolyl cis-trans isomerase D